MQTIRFRLSLTAREYEQYYRGTVKAIVTRALDGRTIRFPCNILQRFVGHDGIHGEFVLIYDDNNKFQSIEKLR